MKFKLLSLLFLVCFSTKALASVYPIEPRPLRLLVKESPTIVVAKVTRIQMESNAFATLQIQEVLQGSIKSPSIQVSFSPYMSCPAPAHYEENTLVLAFLVKGKKNYYTHALSYGAKTLDEASIEIYKKRILEMQQILKSTDEQQQKAQTTDWLIRCVESPATRWEGIYDLDPTSGFMSRYDSEQKDFIQIHFLNQTQKAHLRKILLNIKELRYEDTDLIKIIDVDQKDQELFNFLVQKVKQDQSEYWYTSERLLYSIAKMSDQATYQQFVEALEALDFRSSTADEDRLTILKKFKQSLNSK